MEYAGLTLKLNPTDNTEWTVTGADPGQKRVSVPSSVDGHPVSRIASKAFADRRDIREISLPETIREIDEYAFYNCPELGKLSLFNSAEGLPGGCVRLCPELKNIVMTVRGNRFRMLKDLSEDISGRFFLSLRFEDGEAKMLFPEYFHEIHEDTHARAIHQSIVGAGYAYRQCISRAGIDCRAYDGCFSRVNFSVTYKDDPESLTGGIIAVMRLMYPYRLAPRAESNYTEYVKEHGAHLLVYFSGLGDSGAVRFLLKMCEFAPEALKEASLAASGSEATEVCGLILDELSVMGNGAQEIETFSL